MYLFNLYKMKGIKLMIIKNKNLKYNKLPIVSREKIYENKDSQNKNTKFITALLIIFIVVLLFLDGYSMAKIINEIIIKGQAQIAEPIFIVENNPAVDITESKENGEYVFKVKNYNEQNKVSEIDLKYNVEIISNLNDAISVELYQDENKIDLIEGKTEDIILSKSNKEEREYKIKIFYDNENNILEDIIGKIQVKVNTIQNI